MRQPTAPGLALVLSAVAVLGAISAIEAKRVGAGLSSLLEALEAHGGPSRWKDPMHHHRP